METKHTKEYAESEAKKAYLNTNHSLSEVAAFTYGYLHAVEKTAAPELLEALIELEKVTTGCSSYTRKRSAKEKAINAINKATK